MVVDNNKEVQKAGCSALATIEEEAGQLVVPFIEPILHVFAIALKKYQVTLILSQARNLLTLYDAFGTLADSVKSHLRNPVYVEVFMPLLMEKWSNIQDDDVNIFPLLEVFANFLFLVSFMHCISNERFFYAVRTSYLGKINSSH